MRRSLNTASIATLVLLLGSLPAAAQHGGGHAGGGHAGFSGGHSGGFSGHTGFSGGHVSGGMRSGATAPRGFNRGPSFSQRASSRGPFLHNDFLGSRSRNFRFRNNCYGYGCRFGYYSPYAYGGFYDPYWWWDSGSYNYDQDYQDNLAQADQMDQQSLQEQDERQQEMLRQEQADGDQDLYVRRNPAPRSSASESQNSIAPAAMIPPTVLVFRDQHKQEISNYAIVGQTLWSFGSPHTQKIPLADLDLPATVKANDERGLTFRLPGAGEAQ